MYRSASCCASWSRPPLRRYARALRCARVITDSVSFVASSLSAWFLRGFDSFPCFFKLF